MFPSNVLNPIFSPQPPFPQPPFPHSVGVPGAVTDTKTISKAETLFKVKFAKFVVRTTLPSIKKERLAKEVVNDSPVKEVFELPTVETEFKEDVNDCPVTKTIASFSPPNAPALQPNSPQAELAM